MHTDVIIAGFGGQGVLLTGRMLALAAMQEGKQVCWLPSYGPEMRGGTANCTVVISDRTIGSPVVTRPCAVVALNLPSLDKFEPQLRPQGIVVVNTSLVQRPLLRSDLRLVAVAANDVANDILSPRSANMVTLGAYLGATHVVSLAVVQSCVEEVFAQKPEVAAANVRALASGYALGETAVTAKGLIDERC